MSQAVGYFRLLGWAQPQPASETMIRPESINFGLKSRTAAAVQKNFREMQTEQFPQRQRMLL